MVTRDGDVPVLSRVGSRPHRLSVAACDDSMRLVATRMVDLADSPVRLDDFSGLVVVPNAGDETFAGLRLDERSWAAVTAGLSSVESTLTRALLWWTAVDLAGSRVMSVADLVGLADRHLGPERHPVVFEGVLRLVMGLVRTHASPDEVAGLLAVLSDVARWVLGSDDALLAPAASRALVGTTGDADLLRRWLDRDDVEQAVRWTIVQRLAELGDDAFVAPEQERDRSVSGHHAALAARAALATPAAKAEAWELLLSGTLGNHEFTAVASGFWGWEQADLVAPHVERYLPEALGLARRSGQGMAKVIGAAFPRLPLPDDVRRSLREQLVETLATGAVPTVLARSWNDSLDDLDRVLGT